MPNCVNCGAPMRFSSERCAFVCAHCGSERPLPGGMERLQIGPEAHGELCPLCGVALSESLLVGHELLACTRCFGLLIPMQHFAALIDALRVYEGRSYLTLPRREQEPGERRLECPRCHQPMANHLYGGPGNVVIDTCEPCLLNWLDPGELRRIVLAPTSRPPHGWTEPPGSNDD